MTKTLSRHPLVKMSPSEWARLCDSRRMFEIRKALRAAGVAEDKLPRLQS
jgi:hypothetical protein